MRHQLAYSFLFLMLFSLSACQKDAKQEDITEHLKYCQALLVYEDGLLIANHGTDLFNPLNTEGRGYVTYYKEGKNHILIPSDGNLSAPKAMAVKDDYLFIADVNSLVIYYLLDKREPQIILFPEEDLLINDILISGHTLFAAVANTGRVYVLNVENPAEINPNTLLLYKEVPFANSLSIAGSHFFIGAGSVDTTITGEHIIYTIDNLTEGLLRSASHNVGHYESLLLASDNMQLYFADWTNGGRIGILTFETGELEFLTLEKPITHPGKMVWLNNLLYVPDVGEHTVRAISME